uniref:Protein HEXIM1 n=1 Tax=Strigamia maritima TaxID=126957 RepID=T1IVB5_STRMM
MDEIAESKEEINEETEDLQDTSGEGVTASANMSDMNISNESESCLQEDRQKTKKHNRGKGRKHKWRPYYKLSWKEKDELDDRSARRAAKKRERRFAHGQPVAPYNTTQFLMEDQNVREPDLEMIATGHRHHRESTSLESSDEFYSSPEDEEEFLQKEFSEVYERINAERLNSMSKSELIQEYIQLEDRVDKFEQKLKSVTESKSNDTESESQPVSNSQSENAEKIKVFDAEIKKLTKANHLLKKENMKLSKKV